MHGCLLNLPCHVAARSFRASVRRGTNFGSIASFQSCLPLPSAVFIPSSVFPSSPPLLPSFSCLPEGPASGVRRECDDSRELADAPKRTRNDACLCIGLRVAGVTVLLHALACRLPLVRSSLRLKHCRLAGCWPCILTRGALSTKRMHVANAWFSNTWSSSITFHLNILFKLSFPVCRSLIGLALGLSEIMTA